MANLRIVPPGLKPIQAYLKIAEEHEKRDPSITYWCKFIKHTQNEHTVICLVRVSSFHLYFANAKKFIH